MQVRNYFIMFALICLSFILSGCGTTHYIDRPVIKTEVKIIKPPQYFLKRCAVKEPIAKDDYLKLTPPQREAAMATYSIDLLGNIAKCNEQIDQIRTFIEKEEESIQKNKGQ